MMWKAVIIFIVGFICVDSFTYNNIPNYFPVSHRRAGGNSRGVVAFSAGLSNSTGSQVATNITFDLVYVNAGDGYDNQTGIFTAPVGGTYVFIYHALSQAHQQLWLDLYRNSEYIITGYAHSTNGYASSTNAVVLTLAKGDDVYIRARGDDYVYGRPDEVYSTFSGFMVFPSRA